jgi:hypothetical protein
MKPFLTSLERLRHQLPALLVAAGVPVLLIAPIATGILDRFDYPFHREAAWGLTWPAHFLYYLALTAFRVVSGDWLLGQKLLLFTNYAALGLTLYVFLTRTTATRLAQSLVALLAASLVFGYVIPALQPVDDHFYKGYLAINVYHNSTSLLLKPIIALHLLWLYLWLSAERHGGIGFHAIGALLVVLSALAKPSYLVVLLPALFLIVARDTRAWRTALLAVFLPGIAVLAWLFLSTYGGSGGLEIAPFKVLSHFTAPWTILPKAVLSLLFPLSLLLLFRREVLSDRLAVLCWLMLLIGFSYGLLLAERGERVFDGNWLWSGQVAAFALFAATLRLLLELQAQVGRNWRTYIAWMVFFSHLAGGLAWYLVQFQDQPTLYW